MADGKREVVISLKWEELKYHIENLGFIIGDTMGDDAQHVKHLVQDICKEGNIDHVSRVLHLAYSRCLDILHEYVKEPLDADGAWANDVLKDKRCFRFVMNVPSTFSTTSVESLRHYLHHFFVYSVLADWFSIVFPDAAERFLEKKYEAEDGITNIKYAGLRTFTRKLHPF